MCCVGDNKRDKMEGLLLRGYIVDSLKKLKLEYEGIRKTILDYTSEGNIVNFLDGLKRQIEIKDIEAIAYYIGEIHIWYENNINQIHENEFVVDPSAHDRNKKILEEIQAEFQRNKEIGKEAKRMYSKVFLSHNSFDKKYGDAIRNLLISLGIKKEQLIYTSHPLHKIPEGNNIFDYLKQNIQKDILVIFLWSNEYLKSAACLNEMGAAWIIESDYINMYTPDFDFNNPQYHNCAVDTKKMGVVLKNDEHCKMGMVELKQKLIRNLGLEIDEQEWIFSLDEFMKNIV